MRILEIRERDAAMGSAIRNAYIDFSAMTCSTVAVVTDREVEKLHLRRLDVAGGVVMVDVMVLSSFGSVVVGESVGRSVRIISAIRRPRRFRR